jgi:hypothetical protein
VFREETVMYVREELKHPAKPQEPTAKKKKKKVDRSREGSDTTPTPAMVDDPIHRQGDGPVVFPPPFEHEGPEERERRREADAARAHRPRKSA